MSNNSLTYENIKEFVDKVKESETETTRTLPVQFYYPAQKRMVQALYNVKLESNDCVEKGVRFIEITIINSRRKV